MYKETRPSRYLSSRDNLVLQGRQNRYSDHIGLNRLQPVLLESVGCHFLQVVMRQVEPWLAFWLRTSYAWVYMPNFTLINQGFTKMFSINCKLKAKTLFMDTNLPDFSVFHT